MRSWTTPRWLTWKSPTRRTRPPGSADLKAKRPEDLPELTGRSSGRFAAKLFLSRPGLGRPLESKSEVHGDREGQVHQPGAGHRVEEAKPPLGYVDADRGEEVAEVDREQEDEQQPDWPVSDMEEHGGAQRREHHERHAHAGVGPPVGTAAVPVPAEREPVDAVRGERERRHVQRRVRCEDLEPGQPDEQDNASEELAESGHPDAPRSHAAVHALVGLRPSGQFLRPVDQVTRAQAEKAESQWREGRSGERHIHVTHLVTNSGRLWTGLWSRPGRGTDVTAPTGRGCSRDHLGTAS